MIRILKSDQFDIAAFKTTPIQAGNEIEARVDAILNTVREKGDSALIEYANVCRKKSVRRRNKKRSLSIAGKIPR